MRKVVLALCVVFASLALPSIALGQVQGRDSVVGGGSVDADASTALSFDVRSGPLGENPTGEVSFRLEPGGPVLTSNSVDCLAVNGSTATFAGTWRPNPYGMTHYGITVVDAGPAASTPDLLGMVSTTNAPVGCAGHGGVNLPLITGGVVVTDAQPLPTSNDQCKNGGWRNYGGVFKNQGDCVSFVATGGKNPRTGSKKP